MKILFHFFLFFLILAFVHRIPNTQEEKNNFCHIGCRTLGSGGSDLVSKAQILAYYELVMKDLLATGRVEFYPMCDYRGNGKFVSILDQSVEYSVTVRRKTVDATYLNAKVPSTTHGELHYTFYE